MSLLKRATGFRSATRPTVWQSRTESPIRLRALADHECIDANLPYRGDHAGMCETSQLMALQPGLTDLRRRTGNKELRKRYAGAIDFSKGPLPTAGIGRKIVASQVQNLGNMARRLLGEYRVNASRCAPDLNATEAIWNKFARLNRKAWTFRYRDYAAKLSGRVHIVKQQTAVQRGQNKGETT